MQIVRYSRARLAHWIESITFLVLFNLKEEKKMEANKKCVRERGIML